MQPTSEIADDLDVAEHGQAVGDHEEYASVGMVLVKLKF
jgi:hypothetical protein